MCSLIRFYLLLISYSFVSLIFGEFFRDYQWDCEDWQFWLMTKNWEEYDLISLSWIITEDLGRNGLEMELRVSWKLLFEGFQEEERRNWNLENDSDLISTIFNTKMRWFIEYQIITSCVKSLATVLNH